MMTQTSQRDLKAQLVSFARQIGFDSCRIAACTEPAHASEFRQWLRDGAHGEIHYMQRGEEKRCDPQKVLPGARSIVVLALNYFQGEQVQRSPRPAGATGRIARYAWGEDYHEVIAAKLNKIDQFLRGFGGQQKCYVDTGPVLERDHAAHDRRLIIVSLSDTAKPAVAQMRNRNAAPLRRFLSELAEDEAAQFITQLSTLLGYLRDEKPSSH